MLMTAVLFLLWTALGAWVFLFLCANDFLPPELPDHLARFPCFPGLLHITVFLLWPALIPLSIYYRRNMDLK